MSQSNVMSAPVLESLRPTGGKWECERSAFQRLLPELLQTHRGQFVAVHDGQVVASGERIEEVALTAYAQHGYVPIYVGLVTDQPVAPARIPTPRVVTAERVR